MKIIHKIIANPRLKDIIRYNIYYFVAFFILYGIDKLLINPFLIRRLNREDFGVFIIIMTISNLMVSAIPGSINAVLIREHAKIADKRRLYNASFTLTFIVTLSIILVLVGFFPILAAKLNLINYNIYFYPLMLFTFFLSLREIYIGYCRVELKFKYISIQNVLLGVLYLMIIPLYFMLNRLGIGVGYSIAGIAAFIIIILGMENLGRLNLRNYDIIKIFFKFGPYFLVGGFLHLFMRLLDRFFIAHFLGTDQVTVYFTAASTVLILAFPFSQLSAILLPIISQKKDFSDFKKKDVRNLVYFSVLTVSVVLICGLVFGKLIISILYGSDFYQLSKYCFFILLVSYSLQFMIHYTKHFIDVFLNPNVNLYTVIVAVILNIIGNYFFIPIWGIVGAALATSISLITYATMWFTIFLKKIYLQL